MKAYWLCQEKLATYLEEWVLQKTGAWWSAKWQSGLGQVCAGYGTYISNSQERAWRTMKGLFKKGFAHQDVSHLVRDTASVLRSLAQGGQYTTAACQIRVPPESLAYSAKRLKSEREDEEEKQSNRLTLDLLRDWLAKEGQSGRTLNR